MDLEQAMPGMETLFTFCVVVVGIGAAAVGTLVIGPARELTYDTAYRLGPWLAPTIALLVAAAVLVTIYSLTKGELVTGAVALAAELGIAATTWRQARAQSGRSLAKRPGADRSSASRHPIPPSGQRPSIIDVLAEAPGGIAFRSAAEVDAYLREERDSWER